MRAGYWQIPLHQDSKKYTAFTTHDGATYHFNVLPFGLKAAPRTCQALMTREVLDIECQNTTTPQVKHLDAIKNFAPPQTKRQLQAFIGTCNWVRQYLPNLASFMKPLTSLLQKDKKYKWTSECQEAFSAVQDLVSQPLVLHRPDFDKPFILNTDASETGLGAVLYQEGENNAKHIISYSSATLNKTEHRHNDDLAQSSVPDVYGSVSRGTNLSHKPSKKLSIGTSSTKTTYYIGRKLSHIFIAIPILGYKKPSDVSKRGTITEGCSVMFEISYIIMVEDVFSKWTEAKAYHSVAAHDVVNFLEEEIISRCGAPRRILSDNGPAFVSREYQKFCQKFHIPTDRVAIYHQRANPVERKVQDLKKVLRALTLNKAENTWDVYLPQALHTLRNRQNAATTFTPSQIVLGFSTPNAVDWQVPTYAQERAHILYGKRSSGEIC
ncbi:uncharacterized protein LOC108903881 [Anoplophora glabripennis]|uniref:uncharacterized protein LOC108903881 n=1 Tax=Anoplophora glabripennis TaxID=217634 RepID=UPI0008747B47|nr:uncharacterized protein LOC108903881 [Anoplophora glabripennis]